MWTGDAASIQNPNAKMAARIPKNAPTRIQKATASTIPTSASTSTHRVASGSSAAR
jgi:hypothetical protein